MKKLKMIGTLLFWLTIVSLPISFCLSSEIGEVEIFGVAGIVRYSWIMWLFLPIGLLSIIAGKLLKNRGLRYKQNIIVALICIPILVVFGSFRFLFDTIHYNDTIVSSIEQKINFEFPDNMKIANNELSAYTLSYAKINDEATKSSFEDKINDDSKWTMHLPATIKNSLPMDIQVEIQAADYFIFYNEQENSFNLYPDGDDCVCVFVAYDSERGRLIILNEYYFISN